MPRTTTEPLNQAKWEVMYGQLQAFQKEHGHCRVPQTFGELGKWTKLQRKKYKQQKMPPDRIDRLNALGFLWTVTAASNSNKDNNDATANVGILQDNNNNDQAYSTSQRIPLKFVPGLQKEGLWNEKYQQVKAVCDGISSKKSSEEQAPHSTGEPAEEDRKPAAVDNTAASVAVKTKASQHQPPKSASAPSFATSYTAWTILKEQHPALYKWLQEQRKKVGHGKLSPSCIQKLCATFSSPIWMVEPSWIKMYQLLTTYATQHGSCKVLCSKPRSINSASILTVAGKAIPKKHRALYEWVQQQRRFEHLLHCQSALVKDFGANANNNNNNNLPPLMLEQAEWLQAIPGWIWETGQDDADGRIVAEDDEEFGAYFLKLKRLQVEHRVEEEGTHKRRSTHKGTSITKSGAFRINISKGGKLGKFVQLQRKLYKEQYADGHDGIVPDADATVKGIESLAAAAETVEAAAVGDKRKEKSTFDTPDDVATMVDTALMAAAQQDTTVTPIAALAPHCAKKMKMDHVGNDLETAAALAVENAHGSQSAAVHANEDETKMATDRKKKTAQPKMVLTKRKIQLLDSIGFSWNASHVQHTWEDMFEQLLAYKNEYGDCLVSKRYKPNPKLGMWVGKQRDRYKKMLSLQSSGDAALIKKSEKPYWDNVKPLTQDQLDLLNGIGFVWRAGGPDIIKSDWQSMFEKLKEYQRQHGTCNVSQKAAGDLGRLGRWVKTQREKYHRSKDNLSPLTPEQQAQLESIGFEWRPGGSTTHDETWQTMYNDLKAFRDEHGNCKVPQKKGKLGGWVDRQRKRYRATLQAREFMAKPGNEGLKPPSLVHNTIITDDQIHALNDIGFVWQLRDRSKNENGLDVVGREKYNGLDDNEFQMVEDPYHQHHPHAMQPHPHHFAHPHHGQAMLVNAPEDEAATRTLLFFQGSAIAPGAAGTNPGMGYGMPPQQYNFTMPQAYPNNNYAPAGSNQADNNLNMHDHDHQDYSQEPLNDGYAPNDVYDGHFHSEV